ncbi:MAG: glycosyltransferase family 2 protein [Anaerolineales bacterium]
MGSTIALVVLSTLLFLGGTAFIIWIEFHLNLGAPIPVSPPDPDGPLISILIPARNESRNIRRCIECIRAQTYAGWEMIVVDDHSTDDTPDIVKEIAAQDPRIRLFRSKPLPPGWVGKSHALAQGAKVARGEWLCLLDADTFAAPELLASTFHEAKVRGADLLSIVTNQELHSFWERVISPVAFSGLAVVYNLERINDPRMPDAMANGQFILIRRTVYEETGGHHTLSDSILEDRAIAETVKRAGHTILLIDGRALASVRMHTSLKEIWESWVKTIYPGLRDQPEMVLFLAGGAIIGAVIFPAWWIAAWIGLIFLRTLPAGLIFLEATLFWLYFLRNRVVDLASYKIPAPYALTAPIGIIYFSCMMLDSFFRVRSGRGLIWKGRTYLAK